MDLSGDWDSMEVPAPLRACLANWHAAQRGTLHDEDFGDFEGKIRPPVSLSVLLARRL